MIGEIRASALAALKWLGDAAHRRMAVAAFLFILNRWIGHEVAGLDDVTNVVDVALGLLVAAWSKSTPRITAEDVRGASE